jgi:carbon storage regulator
MLILSRKLKESIMVGDNIEISISGIEGDQVKLAISAPKHIDIHRKEIYLSIKEENKQAAMGSGDIAEFLKKMSEDKE